MVNKLIYKKSNFKKLICIIMGLLLCATLFIPKLGIKATDNIITNDNEIKILEIEPGDLFKLTFSGGESIDPQSDYTNKVVIPKSEQSKVEVNGEKINVAIDHITMPEFVSKIDDIDGTYDIVVIGRDNIETRGGQYDTSIGLSSYRNLGQYNLKYRDYTNPFFEEIKDKENVFRNSNFMNNKTEKEYYSENDITKKRMKEIVNIIEKNKLVYMDSNIGRTDDYKERIKWNWDDKRITQTNLFALYNEFNNEKRNLKKVSFDDLEISGIISEYVNMPQEYKRPKIYNVINPTGTESSPYEINGGAINFGFTSMNIKDENLTVKIYIDGDGNGIFDEQSECKINENLQCKLGENNYIAQYKINDKFFGYLSWKIEVIKENGIKTSITNHCIIKKNSTAEKETINVLQVMLEDSYIPNDGNWDQSIVGEPWWGKNDFKYNPTFQKLCSETDYNINIKVVASGYLNKNPDIVKDYDTIIFGIFWNSSYELNDQVLQNIKELVKEGKNVIFTVDSISDNIFPSGKISNLTQKFRDYAGLARYKDPYRINNGVIDEQDIDDSTIFHNNTADNGYSAGITTPHGNQNFMKSSLAKRINSTRITYYPFNLEDKDTLNISSESHTQPFQLNLEDDDVVPVYNFSIDNTEVGDSRNFYYAYSKGNITYCTTLGDGNGNHTEDELKLIINIIVSKAGKVNVNNSPNIASNQLISGSLSNISYGHGKYDYNEYQNNIQLMNGTITPPSISNGFSFITAINDPDNNLIKIKGININNQPLDYNMIDEGADLINNFKESGTEIGVIIPKTYLEAIKASASKKVTIQILAEDEKGASAEADYIVDLSSIASINHGLYEGIHDGVLSINENERTFAKGSTVTFGAYIDGVMNNSPISIKLDEKLGQNSISGSNFKVFTISNGVLTEYKGGEHGFANNIYTYIPSGFSGSGGQVLIRYTEILPPDAIKGAEYTNKILISGTESNPAVVKIGDELPDLF